MTNNRALKLLMVLATLWLGGPAIALAQPANESLCGPLKSGPGQYGPYDFRIDKDKLPIVLTAHFTPAVESLTRGNTATSPGPDIDYTLRAIPNHPNALFSMMRLAEREKTPKPTGARYTVECYFDRAMRFRPDDHVVRMLYTTLLISNKRKPEAMQQLEKVLTSANDNAFTYQNVGLLYFDLGEYPLALIQAHKAIELGLNRQDLREKLQSAGQWKDAVTNADSVSTEPAAAASNPAKP
jgi:tetratricopeptide (TPR) repeat protein